MASLCISVRALLLLICSSLAAVVVLTSSPASADASSLSSLSSTQWMQHLSRPGPYGVRKIKLALAPDVANRDEEAARFLLGDSDDDQNATTIEKKEVKYTSLKQPDDEINDFELWMPTSRSEETTDGGSAIADLVSSLLGVDNNSQVRGDSTKLLTSSNNASFPLVAFVHPTFGMKVGRWAKIYNRDFLEFMVSHGIAVVFPLDLKYDELQPCATCHGPESYEENALAAGRAVTAVIWRENRDQESELYQRFSEDRVAVVGWSTGAASVVKMAHLCDTIRGGIEVMKKSMETNETLAELVNASLANVTYDGPKLACGATDRLRAVVSLAPTIGANASNGGNGLTEYFYDLEGIETPLFVLTGSDDDMGAGESASLFMEQTKAHSPVESLWVELDEATHCFIPVAPYAECGEAERISAPSLTRAPPLADVRRLRQIDTAKALTTGFILLNTRVNNNAGDDDGLRRLFYEPGVLEAALENEKELSGVSKVERHAP